MAVEQVFSVQEAVDEAKLDLIPESVFRAYRIVRLWPVASV